MDEKFKYALERTLTFEGGYANDAADPGGETKFGISARAYPGLDIKALTRDRAGEIYYEDYWTRYGYSRLADTELAAKVFDLAVNMGPRRAHKLLQKAMNRAGGVGLAADGNLGPKTIEAVNGYPDGSRLLAELKAEAVKYYRSLAAGKGMQRFLAGWLRRALA